MEGLALRGNYADNERLECSFLAIPKLGFAGVTGDEEAPCHRNVDHFA